LKHCGSANVDPVSGEPDARKRACPVREGLRHETMDVSVMTDHSGHNPVCDHRYPTKTCGRSNRAVRSSWDNVSSPEPGGRISREGIRRLLAPRRSGTRVDGMANSGELPINVVRTSKPKALTGLNQNGTWPGAGASPFPCRRCRATGEQAEPTPSVIHPWNVVNPSSSLGVGPPQGGRRWDGG
jgi:hypothetical protein